MRHIITSLVAAGAIACATPAATPATIPSQHGSAAAEDRAAREHDHAAGVLERQARSEELGQFECGPGTPPGTPGQICWANPRVSGATQHETLRASEQRQDAAEHRKVSQALREAEARACADIAEPDIVNSPFSHRADIVDAQVLAVPEPDGSRRVVGARVRFHEIEKLTASWLQHVIDCQIARDNAMGHDVPELSYCPLVPRGATATVSVVPHGFQVDITSDDPAGASEIARRALELLH